MFSKETYIRRRAELKQLVGEGVIVLFGNNESPANYPANLESEAEVAKSLEGVVSKETQLKALSLVDNVSDEIERLEAEQTPSVVDNIFGA